MNYTLRALTLTLVSLWFWPPVAYALIGISAVYAPWLVPLAAFPTAFLLFAIAANSTKLPAWAWIFSTPDCPNSPYSQYEPQAAPYYRFGRVIGDYLWFAWRNQLNGLSLRWGATPDYETDKFLGTGSATSGRYLFTVWRNGNLYAWCYRNSWPLFGRVLRVHFGWKWLEQFYLLAASERAALQIIPPAMVAVQVTFHKS